MSRHPWAVPIALMWPLFIAAIGVLVVLTWTPDLPAQVATHWGSGEEPDGFTSRAALPWLVAGLGTVIPLLCTALFLAIGLPTRSTCAIGAGLAAFLTSVVLSTLAPQRGLEDASAVAVDAWWVGASLAAALVVAAVAAATTPRDRYEGTTPSQPVPTVAPPRTWQGATRSELMLGIAAVVVLAGVALLVTGPEIVGVVLVPVALALGATAWWKVTVDDRGVVVRSALPWPRIRIAPDRLTGAEVEHISALGEFGGWGIRMSRRGTGIVLGAGEGVVIHRRDARPLIVVIDDAPGAAAAINSRVALAD